MPVGRKIYYEKQTGNVILTVLEKHHEGAIDTTKEQDFQMYDVLANRDPDQINVLKVAYGEMRSDFEAAKSWKVDVDTKKIFFDYPVREQSHGQQIRALKAENEKKTQQLKQKDEQIGGLMMDLAKEKEASRTLKEQMGEVFLRMAKNNI